MMVNLQSNVPLLHQRLMRGGGYVCRAERVYV